MSLPVVCLMGPTASGKTALAVDLVRRFPLEIVSVDSVMVYRGMTIGAAKPDAETLAAAPHHLIDIQDPFETYSAAQFCGDVHPVIRSIHARGHVPLLTGGTHLYFRAFQQGLSVLPEADASVRQSISERARVHGWPALHEILQSVDPIAAKRIHPNDAQRIQRALEVHMLSGRTMTSFLEHRDQRVGQYTLHNIVIAPNDRQVLHDRIAVRFKKMLEDGLIAEVETLLADPRIHADLPAMRSAGYRQVCAWLSGVISRDELITRGIIATRQLAKRQLTWLRRWEDTVCFDSENPRLTDEVSHLLTGVINNPSQ